MAYDPNLPIDSELVKNLPAAIREKGASLKELIDTLESSFNAHLADTTQAHGLGGIPLVSTGDKTYYIDAINGNDNNNGLSQQTAFKTWAKVEKLIPRIINHAYRIVIIGNINESIRLYNKIIGDGSLTIEGYTTNPQNQQINGVIRIGSILGGWYNRVTIRYFKINGQINIGGTIGVFISNCEPQNPGGAAIQTSASIVAIQNCNFGTNIVQTAILGNLSIIFSTNNSGNATQYGLQASSGTIIAKNGTQPTGTTANEYITHGGEIR